VFRQRKNKIKSQKYDFYDYIFDEAKHQCQFFSGLQFEERLMNMTSKLEAMQL
jgi:hypothetical protein